MIDLTNEETVFALRDLLSNKCVTKVAIKIKVIAMNKKTILTNHLAEPSASTLPKAIQPLATPSP